MYELAPQGPSALVDRLSPRETQVLEMASRGLTNGQIAELLQVTVHAVKFHLAGIYRKLGVGNRTEAAAAYFRAAGAIAVHRETGL